jgi:hypothetical protein
MPKASETLIGEISVFFCSVAAEFIFRNNSNPNWLSAAIILADFSFVVRFVAGCSTESCLHDKKMTQKMANNEIVFMCIGLINFLNVILKTFNGNASYSFAFVIFDWESHFAFPLARRENRFSGCVSATNIYQ